MMIRSNPDRFSSGPNVPPQFASKIVLVKGLFEEIEKQPDVGAVVPVNGPVENILMLFVFNGSRCGLSHSFRIFAA